MIMPKRSRMRRTLKASIYIKFPNEDMRLWKFNKKISAENGKGVIIKDGTPLRRVRGKWVYFPE